MKNNMHRNLIYILLGVALVLIIAIVVVILTGNRAQQTPTPEDGEPIATPVTVQTTVDPSGLSSPEQKVQAFFDCWNRKDTIGMEQLRAPEERGLRDYDDLAYEAAVTLTAVREQEKDIAIAAYNTAWYQDPADVALVHVDYTVTYNEKGREMYVRDDYTNTGYPFWLIRETENGEWYIITQGY